MLRITLIYTDRDSAWWRGCQSYSTLLVKPSTVWDTEMTFIGTRVRVLSAVNDNKTTYTSVSQRKLWVLNFFRLSTFVNVLLMKHASVIGESIQPDIWGCYQHKHLLSSNDFSLPSRKLVLGYQRSSDGQMALVFILCGMVSRNRHTKNWITRNTFLIRLS